jgi:hypothetical protein
MCFKKKPTFGKCSNQQKSWNNGPFNVRQCGVDGFKCMRLKVCDLGEK